VSFNGRSLSARRDTDDSILVTGISSGKTRVYRYAESTGTVFSVSAKRRVSPNGQLHTAVLAAVNRLRVAEDSRGAWSTTGPTPRTPWRVTAAEQLDRLPAGTVFEADGGGMWVSRVGKPGGRGARRVGWMPVADSSDVPQVPGFAYLSTSD
jgi:hypothetical protein